MEARGLIDRERYLAHLVGDEERLLGARLLDQAEQALRDGEPKATPFLDPAGRQVAEGILGSLPGVGFRAYGGHSRAERQRIVVFPDYYLTELIDPPIRAVEATGRFDEPPSHRDVLGSVLGLGIAREQVGDIIPLANGAQVIVSAELSDFITAQWTRIGRTPVTCEEIDFERLAVEPQRVKEIRTTVASLRLDAVAAAGFGTSRTKMAREIRAERVKLNWRVVSDPAAEVKEGDVLSIRGRGRVHVESVEGTTRKGRINAILKRYM